jgi:hypothetical protein
MRMVLPPQSGMYIVFSNKTSKVSRVWSEVKASPRHQPEPGMVTKTPQKGIRSSFIPWLSFVHDRVVFGRFVG